MKLSSSVTTALIIFGLIILYFAVRTLSPAATPSNAGDQTAASDIERITVVTETISPQDWRDVVTVRGRTKAERKVTVRAETSGTIAETPTALGAQVKEGDVLCRLRVAARQAAQREARAALKKARLDYNAALELAGEGFRSETSVASMKAALDLASANVERATIDLDHTTIKAPFDGVFDGRSVEVGDYVRIGDPCGVVIQRSPFLVVGAVPERDVAKITTGDPGEATLATGEILAGTVRFVASAANPDTRTFDVELQVPNDDGALRDGVTATFRISAQQRAAHLLPRSALILDDEGRIGVRHISDNNTVAFTPVSLIGEGASGVWVNGLTGAAQVIIRGQNYVRAGEQVNIAKSGKSTASIGPQHPNAAPNGSVL